MAVLSGSSRTVEIRQFASCFLLMQAAVMCTTNIGCAVNRNDDRIFNIAHHYFNECMNVLNLENTPLIRHSCVLGIISAI